MSKPMRPRSLSLPSNRSDTSFAEDYLEEYVDATEHVTYGDSLDLLDTLSEVQITLNLFLNNKFDLAEERMATLADRSMYHALGYSSILFIKAMLTCDKKDLEHSNEVCKSACNVVMTFRQKHTLTESIFGVATQRTKDLTDAEIHAELVYAEVLLIRAILSFFNDDNFASFIKGALNIRTCFRLYRSCQKMMNDENLWEGRDRRVKDQFEAGVRMGIGTFNLMLSTLPSKVIRLLEVVGFSGDRNNGMSELLRCSSMTNTLYAPFATMTILTWNLVITFLFGAGQPDIPMCRKLLTLITAKYGKGSIALFLRARLLLVSGDVNSSVYYFNMSIDSQNLYKQFHHGCYWELLFAHGYEQQWTKAANYARRLMVESKWSRCVYTYMLCIFFAADETTDLQKREETVTLLAGKVDALRLRIAGKSIPIEKFCARRTNRYKRTGSLLFAHYEFIYFWNGFDIMTNNTLLLDNFVADLDKVWFERKETGEGIQTLKVSLVDGNDKCLYLFLRAVCQRHLKLLGAAEVALQEVLRESNEGHLTDFHYLYPNALYELALVKICKREIQEADHLLAEARKIRGFPLENKLQFRIHSAM